MLDRSYYLKVFVHQTSYTKAFLQFCRMAKFSCLYNFVESESIYEVNHKLVFYSGKELGCLQQNFYIFTKINRSLYIEGIKQI
ncbi:MAG: hypothetical protein BGN96_10285 [Bacteroidales bacterium 45-6]|nr:MAG: hypothetical protein BGN96_10285 [Bacteroidales bacterium 45-6]